MLRNATELSLRRPHNSTAAALTALWTLEARVTRGMVIHVNVQTVTTTNIICSTR
jgi:hypothetical protein